MGGADISTPMSLAMVVMKTVSSGIFGLSLIFMYWKTRNLWGIALAHGLYDFVSIAQEAIFFGDKALGANGPTAFIISRMKLKYCIYAVSKMVRIAGHAPASYTIPNDGRIIHMRNPKIKMGVEV